MTAINILLLLFTIVVLFIIIFTYFSKEQHNKKQSSETYCIIQALNTLPIGILFYDEKGDIHLKNDKMQELLFAFSKKKYHNGKKLWDELKKEQTTYSTYKKAGENFLLKAKNETWQLTKNTITINNITFFEITAIEVSELMQTHHLLLQEREILIAQNKEAKLLRKKQKELHKEREYIRIRTQVHDVLSQRLTAIQRISQNSDFTDYTDLLSLSKDTIAQIKTRQGGNASELFGDMYFFFRKIGLSIELLNALPEENTISFLILAVLREACTNAIKHAGATKVYVKIKSKEDNYRIEITNNGTSPKQGLVEGGGLFGIRSRVENAGGVLKVEVIPKFSLIITIGKENLSD